jgi:hypothetical protein
MGAASVEIKEIDPDGRRRMEYGNEGREAEQLTELEAESKQLRARRVGPDPWEEARRPPRISRSRSSTASGHPP